MAHLSPASNEIHHIIPLGLTLGEARAWYINHVMLPRLRPASVCLIAALMLFLVLASRIGAALDNTLSNMILLHFLFMATGFATAYAITSILDVAASFLGRASHIRPALKKVTAYGVNLTILVFAGAGAIVVFWHLPAELDAAASNGSLLIWMHLALLFAGGLIFVGSQFLSRNVKMLVPVIAGKAIGLYGMFLLLIPAQLYVLYPLNEQATTGVTLLVLMLVLDFTLVPAWLYSYFGKSPRDTAGLPGKHYR